MQPQPDPGKYLHRTVPRTFCFEYFLATEKKPSSNESRILLSFKFPLSFTSRTRTRFCYSADQENTLLQQPQPQSLHSNQARSPRHSAPQSSACPAGSNFASASSSFHTHFVQHRDPGHPQRWIGPSGPSAAGATAGRDFHCRPGLTSAPRLGWLHSSPASRELKRTHFTNDGSGRVNSEQQPFSLCWQN